MMKEFFYNSCGAGQICAYQWVPEGEVKAIVQIVHGIAERAERYAEFAAFLNSHGIMAVAEDHMGHGKSIGKAGIQGYFHGGWFSAVEDTYALMQSTMAQFPGVPYILFGHSMGSFMARTILAKHPDSGITGCIICGTAWQPKALLKVAVPMCKLFCKGEGERSPNPVLQNMMFGNYNARVEHPRTFSDWLTRDNKIVDAFVADPLCGFAATAGLYRDMLMGISYVQSPEALRAMKKEEHILFVAGSDDPVGGYGKGVEQAAQAFRSAGMTDVGIKLYPLCRHEILNEINRGEIYQDLLAWINKYI